MLRNFYSEGVSMNAVSTDFFGRERIGKILFRLAPPIMFAQLIQALYNIVDSFFIGQYSEEGLTALSIIYPLQLLMIALAVGTGVGINTYMARLYGLEQREKADEVAGVGTVLAALLWILFAAGCYFAMPFYAEMSTDSQTVAELVVRYGRIVCVFSIGLFLESVWTKIHQARGNMKIPMLAQITGAVVNIILDPILIFGFMGSEPLGITGAAIATVIGQVAAAVIVGVGAFRKSPVFGKYKVIIVRVYRDGLPNILMQSAYTFYILGLNLILAGFSDNAVTALGLYYKWQTFFFIPLGGLQTCIVPIISYNYATGNVSRCKRTLRDALLIGMALMAIGLICFELIPTQMLSVFTKEPEVISIGAYGFHFIGVSFIPMVTSLIFPVFFQSLGKGLKSMALTVIRTVFLFVPIGWILSRFGFEWFWLTFPITETVTSLIGFLFYRGFAKNTSANLRIERM